MPEPIEHNSQARRAPARGALLLIPVAVLALLAGLGRLLSPAPPPVTRNLTVTTRQEITVRGRLQLDPRALGTAQGTRVVFHFPEATLDIEKPLEELSLQPDGSFTARLTLDVERRPRQMVVSARRNGCQEARLTQVAIGADQVRLPPVTLHPLPRLVSERPNPGSGSSATGRSTREQNHQRMAEKRAERKRRGSNHR